MKLLLLSPRQTQVLNLIARGFTDREIGAMIGIRPDTVGEYAQTVMRKIKAKSRSHAVGILFCGVPAD